MEDTAYIGDDIVFKSKAGALIITAGLDNNTAPRASAAPATTSTTPSVWANWGDNNLEPKEIASDIENIGVLNVALGAKGRIATGKGIHPRLLFDIDQDGTEHTDYCDDSEVNDFLEANNHFDYSIDSIYDKLGYGWRCGSFVTNLGQNKIVRIKRHDVYEARLAKKEPLTGLIKNLYLSADWEKAGTIYTPGKQVRIEMLEEGNELKDLEERITGNSKKVEFAFANRNLRNGRHYYPQPTYRSNQSWLKIARSVPKQMIAMYNNQITINYLVTIHPKFFENKVGLEWTKYTPEQRRKVQDEYYDKVQDWLVGEDKAYKSLFTSGYIDEVSGVFTPYVNIQVVDNKLKAGALLPDSGAAMAEIYIALMLNPALLGGGNTGGKAYGDTSQGSNVRESFLVQLMLMESERKENAGPLNVVKHFNGWAKRLEVEKVQIPMGVGQVTPKPTKPRLVWRYQSGLLTSLDTGKSTKAENL